MQYQDLIKTIKITAAKIIAIDGRCAAGKTTLAGKMAEELHCKVVHMDDYYLPFNKRTDSVMQKPGGHMDYERIIDEIFAPLKAGREAWCHPYDCHNDIYGEKYVIKPDEMLIIEGAYSCHPGLEAYYDYKIFLDIAPEEQERRLTQRNPERVEMFQKMWIPREEFYFEAYRVEEKSDVVMEMGGEI